MNARAAFVLVVASAAALGCSSTKIIEVTPSRGLGDAAPMVTDDAGASVMVSGSAGVGLHVGAASMTSEILTSTGGAFHPSAGNVFLVVDLTLRNDGAPRPLSTSFALFTLATKAALVVNASVDSAFEDPKCDPSTSIALGGNFECKVAFEIAPTQSGVTLTYDDAHGDSASATIPAATATASGCTAVEAWKHTSTNTCVSCLSSMSMKACATQTAAFQSQCSSACPSATFALSSLTCAAEAACMTVMCRMALDAIDQCLATECGSVCQ